MTTPTPHGAPELPKTDLQKLRRFAAGYMHWDGARFFGDVFQLDAYTRAAIQQAAGAVPEDMSCPGCLVGTLHRRLLKSKNRVLAAKVCDNCKIELFGQEQSEYNKNSRDVSTPSPLGREAGKEGSSDHLVPCAGGRVTQWQPIGTAPEDGTPIFIADIEDGQVYDVVHGHFEVLTEDEDDGPWDIRDGKPWCSYEGRAEGIYFCSWLPGKEYDPRWRFGPNSGYTHWMPAPAAPAPRPDAPTSQIKIVVNDRLPEDVAVFMQDGKEVGRVVGINPGSAPREDGHG